MGMKYLMGLCTCELGDTSASQQQNFHDIKVDGQEAFPSPLLLWGQCWLWPEGSVSQWQVSFGKQWLLLTPELPALPTEDPKLLPGAKLMFLTYQSTRDDCNALQGCSHIHRQLFISSQLRTTWNQIQSPTSSFSSLAK